VEKTQKVAGSNPSSRSNLKAPLHSLWVVCSVSSPFYELAYLGCMCHTGLCTLKKPRQRETVALVKKYILDNLVSPMFSLDNKAG